MRVPYLVSRARTPQPSLGGSLQRPRPILAVRILGPGSSLLRDGLLDTGADDTVLPDWSATVIGLVLAQAEARDIGLTGRQPVTCRYAPVRLRISDGVSETYEWPAVVGFVALPIPRPLLGYAGFSQYFDAEFRGSRGDSHPESVLPRHPHLRSPLPCTRFECAVKPNTRCGCTRSHGCQRRDTTGWWTG